MDGKNILCPICQKDFPFNAEFLMTTCPECLGMSPLDNVDLQVIMTHLMDLKAEVKALREAISNVASQVPAHTSAPTVRRSSKNPDEIKAREAAKHLLTYANASHSVVEEEVKAGSVDTVKDDLIFDAMQLFVQEENRRRLQNERDGSVKPGSQT